MKLIKVFKEPEVYKGTRYWNANLIEFEGKEYIVSHKAILTLVTVSSCNAACKFCSNDITYNPNGSYMKFNEELKRLLDFSVLGGINKVAFSGGEPTANPQKLYDLASHFIPNFKTSRIHTNGYGLMHSISNGEKQFSLLEGLMEKNLSGITLSIAHNNHDINQEIMRFNGRWKGLTESDIDNIINISNNELSIRMSCVLTSKGVKSVDDMLRYIEWGRSLGVKRFIFRSPSWIPSEYAKETAVTRYNRLNHVNIDPITDALDKHPDFKIKFSEHKTDSHVHVYTYNNDVTIDIDASSEEPDPDNKIRRIIVMANQVPYTSWINPHSYLFDNHQEIAMNAARKEFPKLEVAY
ncbi:radical SAM protein [Bacillus sp. CH_442]|uniref:radical SAM protein n=1 Tax=Bacillus sp. CH_442 TaxID=2978217 RepID=UPI0030F65488|nr:radical SAM protein [Bacillus thuringiensis]